MDCDSVFHDGLKEMEYIFCPFCNSQFEFVEPQKNYFCCDKQNIIKDNGEIVCQNCGIVHGFDSKREFIEFHEFRFRRKSVYHRKYHIDNKLIDIQDKYGIILSCQDQIKIKKIFLEIGKIHDEVKNERKRIININFIICKILERMKISHEKIPISESKRTLNFYNQYWNEIEILIGEKIKFIIQ